MLKCQVRFSPVPCLHNKRKYGIFEKNTVMKILLMTTSSTIAGTEKNVLSLAVFLKSLGHDPELLTFEGDGSLNAEFVERSIPAHLLDIKRKPLSLLGLGRFLKNGRYGIVHSFLFHANILSRVFAPAGVLLINSYRSEDKWKRWYHYLIERITIKRTDAITVNFPADALFLKKHGIKTSVYIPNGTTLKERVLPPRRPFTVALIGRFHKVKGHRELIEAYASVKGLFGARDIRFVFRGKGPLKRSIEELIKREPQQPFFLEPFTENERELYSGISAVICVSRYEGFPNTLLESAAYGIPALSFRAGAAAEIILDGTTGFLVDDFRGLFVKIALLYDNEELFGRMCRAAHEHAKKEFSSDRVNDRYRSLYRTHCKGGEV